MSARDPTQGDRAAGAGAAAAAHHQPWARRYWSQLLHPAGSLGWVVGGPSQPHVGSHTDVTAFLFRCASPPSWMGRDGAARPRAWLGLGLGWAGLVAGFGAVGGLKTGAPDGTGHRAAGSSAVLVGPRSGQGGLRQGPPMGLCRSDDDLGEGSRVVGWMRLMGASCAETAERIDQIPRGSNAEILLVVYSQPGDPWMLLHETDPLAFAWPDRALDYFDGAAHHAPSLTLAAAAAASHASHHSCIGANYSSPSPRARG
ncbi:hypothetical protein PCL_00394 [Purpureocillium lilacinum]|uniref:Uncharacterized protein n=1 Tax=Purpureocillium lilacinum TaxID=33203 RepID=A0A2U3E6W2_PURLI|nr:hypothetical protein PCL_00394 [Purpureocillium lilacinum]